MLQADLIVLPLFSLLGRNVGLSSCRGAFSHSVALTRQPSEASLCRREDTGLCSQTDLGSDPTTYCFHGQLIQTPRSLSSSVKWAQLSYCLKREEMREPPSKHGWLSPGAHLAAVDVTPPAPAGEIDWLGNWEGDSWTHCRVCRAELETLTQLGSPVGCFIRLSGHPLPANRT